MSHTIYKLQLTITQYQLVKTNIKQINTTDETAARKLQLKSDFINVACA